MLVGRLEVHLAAGKEIVGGPQALELGGGDIERDDLEPLAREDVAGPAGVCAEIEDPLASPKVLRDEHLAHRAGLLVPVLQVHVRERQDPVAIPAVGAHDFGEAPEARRFAHDKVGWFVEQVDDPAFDRTVQPTLPTTDEALTDLPSVALVRLHSEARPGVAARAAQHLQQTLAHLDTGARATNTRSVPNIQPSSARVASPTATGNKVRTSNDAQSVASA